MTEDIIDRARRMQEAVDDAGAGKPKSSLGLAVGKVMVKALEDAYKNGWEDGVRYHLNHDDMKTALHLRICGKSEVDPSFDLFADHDEVADLIIMDLLSAERRRFK